MSRSAVLPARTINPISGFPAPAPRLCIFPARNAGFQNEHVPFPDRSPFVLSPLHTRAASPQVHNGGCVAGVARA
jgi:hypothetical protein